MKEDLKDVKGAHIQSLVERLKKGNSRFQSGCSSAWGSYNDRDRLEKHLKGQNPFAVILGCSDSRVPPEIVFDQAPGDLFVVRVAGNIITPAVTGSIEFAVKELKTRLVVVLGHTRCGAVQAAVEELRNPGGNMPPGLRCIVEQIKETISETNYFNEPEEFERRAVRANITAAARQLRRSASSVVSHAISEGGLAVVEAEYSIKTRNVDFSFSGS